MTTSDKTKKPVDPIYVLQFYILVYWSESYKEYDSSWS